MVVTAPALSKIVPPLLTANDAKAALVPTAPPIVVVPLPETVSALAMAPLSLFTVWPSVISVPVRTTLPVRISKSLKTCAPVVSTAPASLVVPPTLVSSDNARALARNVVMPSLPILTLPKRPSVFAPTSPVKVTAPVPAATISALVSVAAESSVVPKVIALLVVVNVVVVPRVTSRWKFCEPVVVNVAVSISVVPLISSEARPVTVSFVPLGLPNSALPTTVSVLLPPFTDPYALNVAAVSVTSDFSVRTSR